MAFLDELIYLVKVNYSGGSFNKMDRDVRRVNKSMSVLKLNLGGVFAGLGAGFGGYQILTGLTDAAKKLDIIKTQFYVITESQEISNQLMKDSSRQAKEYGLDLYTVREGMSGWLGATKGTAIKLEEGRQMYEKLAASIGGMRMTKEEASGALLALGQMISKGKVQAEELRRQLANSLKGAYPIVANALFPGMTPSEAGRALDDALRAGKIDISYMGKIVNAIYGRFGKYAKDNANSVVANFNRMGNAWIALKERLVTSGFNDVLNQFAKSMANLLSNKEFQDAIISIGQLSKLLIPIMKILTSTILFIVKNIKWLLWIALPLLGKFLFNTVLKHLLSIGDTVKYNLWLAQRGGFLVKIAFSPILKLLWAMVAPIAIMCAKTFLWILAIKALLLVTEQLELVWAAFKGEDLSKYDVTFAGMRDNAYNIAKAMKTIASEMKKISDIIDNLRKNPLEELRTSFSLPNLSKTAFGIGSGMFSSPLTPFPFKMAGLATAGVAGSVYNLQQTVYTNEPAVGAALLQSGTDKISQKKMDKKHQ